MKTPYEITSGILRQIASISERIGEINALHLNKLSPQLKKQNRIKFIHSLYQTEKIAYTEKQLRAVIDGDTQGLPQHEIDGILNLFSVYDYLKNFDPYSEQSFLAAHHQLLNGLHNEVGRYRADSPILVNEAGKRRRTAAAEKLPSIMQELFEYTQKPEELILLRSCYFNYKLQSLAPFSEGNKQMGKLWQTLLLMQAYPVFEFLPFEYITEEIEYTLDNASVSIENMLIELESALSKLLDFKDRTLTEFDRIFYFLELGMNDFTRRDYMNVFKDVSTATASRDLRKAAMMGCVKKYGEKNQTRYIIKG